GRKLVTGADREPEAEQFLAEIQPTEVEGVNPFSGRLELVVTPHISGNAWYLMADPATNPCFMYGFLEGQEGPRIRIDEPFGRQGMSFSVEADFGCAAIDWRGVYRNAGA
ncbi:MAG TPA: Clp protease ClpP, partial [Paracoccaceae bacterium]|nr:Clp protease ClpP [Paracoccaceae bacterium]